MEAYKQEFIEFMVDCQVLKFGDFVTKSGRNTPFFVNTGFIEQEHSFASWGNTMPEPLQTSSDLILMYCSVRLTKEYR